MTCKTRPTRRTKSQVTALCDQMIDIAQRLQPMSVRQMFYQLVSLGAIDKTEGEYKNTVCRLLANLRRTRQMPFGWIADGTRWQKKPRTFSSLGHMLDEQQQFYRRALWEDQDVYVEIWLEKEALAGVIYQATAPWDVPLMVTRGYPSISFLYEAAETFSEVGKPVYLYYFGDHDPSGVDIPRFIEESVRDFAPDAEIHFKRLAVLPKQIEQMNLPTRPTKKSDTRSRTFLGESVEVDAISPDQLRSLCEGTIISHLSVDAWEATKRVEQAERETLSQMIAGMAG